MNAQKVKLLLTLSVCAAMVAILCAIAAGSHLHLGWSDGSPEFDFRLAVGGNRASTLLGTAALVLFLAGLALHLSQGTGGVGADWGAAGSSVVAWLSDFTGCLRRIAKSSRDEWLGGVCGGLGEHTPVPSWAWRFMFLMALLCYGTGVLVYIVLWVCLPEPLRGPQPGEARGGCLVFASWRLGVEPEQECRLRERP